MNVRQERHLIERVIHLLRILEENGIESESICERSEERRVGKECL